MIYQLPSGKIIYITTEQFFALSDEELDSLNSLNIGEYAKSPWLGSAIKTPKKKQITEDHEEHDSSIDYTEENEELGGEKPTITNEVIMEDIPDENQEPPTE